MAEALHLDVVSRLELERVVDLTRQAHPDHPLRARGIVDLADDVHLVFQHMEVEAFRELRTDLLEKLAKIGLGACHEDDRETQTGVEQDEAPERPIVTAHPVPATELEVCRVEVPEQICVRQSIGDEKFVDLFPVVDAKVRHCNVSGE